MLSKTVEIILRKLDFNNAKFFFADNSSSSGADDEEKSLGKKPVLPKIDLDRWVSHR